MAQQPKFWQQKNLLAYILWPISLLYSSMSRCHLFLRACSPYRASVPVVSVGNLNVGGVGKTPIVAALAEHFEAEGHRVAILSRGYGGKHKQPYKVTSRDSAYEVGDEPAMLHQKFSDKSIDIWVSPNRVASAKRAISAGATIIILDDGFQYLSLARDLNLLVLDGRYAGKFHLGNGFSLPAGPLREPPYALRRADALLVLNAPTPTCEEISPMPVFDIGTELSKEKIQILKEKQGESKAFSYNVMTAIGRPEKFVTALKGEGVNIADVFAHSDHHCFTHSDMESATSGGQIQTLVTSKDAIKIPKVWRHKFTTVELEVNEESLAKCLQWLHHKLK